MAVDAFYEESAVNLNEKKQSVFYTIFLVVQIVFAVLSVLWFWFGFTFVIEIPVNGRTVQECIPSWIFFGLFFLSFLAGAILFGVFKKVGMFIWIWLSVISVFGTFAVGFGMIGSIIGVVLGLLIAIISMKFFEPLVIIATSIVGGRSIAAGALMLAGMSDNMIINIVVFVVVSVICAVIQFLMQSRKIKKKEVKQAKELRAQESRETEIEMARMLLDEEE